MLFRLTWLLVAAPLTAGDPVADAKRVPADLQGGWRLVAAEAEDETASVLLPDPKPALVIKGHRVLHGGQEIARLTLDAFADPKVIDLKFARPERTYEGIYALEKDSLKLCVNGRTEGTRERPNRFSLDGHPAWRRLTFERIKPEDAGPGTGFVGVQLKYEEKTKEVVVQTAIDGSPAKAAGLKKDDVLLSVGGTGVETLRGAIDLVRAARPGGELALKVRRAGKEVDVNVKVGLIPFAALVGLD
jgi:uncharacterized protein (TIGR03067 family)